MKYARPIHAQALALIVVLCLSLMPAAFHLQAQTPESAPPSAETAPEPPAPEPPAPEPPAPEPPVDNPPVEAPPVENPPVENPPVEGPPAEAPPAENPPAEAPPAENPPAEQPPAENPPAEEPPVENPPAEESPADEPPSEEPPAENPPAQEPAEGEGTEGEDAITPDTEPSEESPSEADNIESTETPDSEATEEADGENASTPESEVENGSKPATPTPTEEPNPVVTWSQPNPVDCRPTSDGFAGFDHLQTETYRCSAVVDAQADPEMPDGMSIKWTIDATFSDQLNIQLTAGSQGSVLSNNQEPGVDNRSMVVEMPWQSESANQSIEFDLVITRTVCEVGDNPISAQAVPTIDNADADVEIVASGTAPERAVETATFLPNLEPPVVESVISDFDSLRWDGASWGATHATGTLTITNTSCATSIDHILRVNMESDVPGLTPVPVLTLDEELASVSPGQIVIPSGFSGSAVVNLQFVLTPPDDFAVGTYRLWFQTTYETYP